MIKKLMMILLICHPLLAEEIQNPLEQYVTEGLRNNLALQQQEFSLEKSLEALKEARGAFFPSISIQGRYSRAGGGRMIEIPIGDMLNPLHKSLNDLYRFHGIDAGFPTNILNEQVPFLREREQETKVRIVQPVFQPAIYYNFKIKSILTNVNQSQVAVYKRQLIADIKTSYFNHSRALRVIEILEETRNLLKENLRVSENLYKNGKVTEDVIFRAKAEIADLDYKMAEAEKHKILAAKYFNFLVNRDLDALIRIDEKKLPSLEKKIKYEEALLHALEHRDEFQQIQYAIKATSYQMGLANSIYLPSLTAVFDYGIQGEEYRFGKDDDYWMASLVFEWTLFNGNQTRAKKAQAELDRKRLEVQKTELEKQIRLQVQEEYQALKTALLKIKAAIKKEESVKKSFEIVSKKYEYGMAPQIEYLDARNTYTNAVISHIIAQYDYFIQNAKFERVSASADLGKYR